MAQDKQLTRIEDKLDALLKKARIDPEDFGAAAGKTATKPTELTQAQKDAIANAPKHIEARPVGAGNPPSAPASPPAMVPSDAVGNVTIETEKTDGEKTVETKPASEVKQDEGKEPAE